MKTPKLLPIAALLIGSILAQSCSKIAEKLNYDVPLQTGTEEIVIPPSSDLTTTHQLGSGTSHYDIDSLIRKRTDNALGINNIKSVKLTSCTITINNPNANNNFQNLLSAYSSFYTSGNSTPYQLNIDNNPDVYATKLDLPVDAGKDLRSYLNGNDFTYNFGGRLRKATTDTLKCTIQYSFLINVGS